MHMHSGPALLHLACIRPMSLRMLRPNALPAALSSLAFVLLCMGQVLASDSSNWVAAGAIAPASNTSTGVIDTDAICIASDGDEHFMFVQNNCTEVRRGSLAPIRSPGRSHDRTES